jgi:hypothetical protein
LRESVIGIPGVGGGGEGGEDDEGEGREEEEEEEEGGERDEEEKFDGERFERSFPSRVISYVAPFDNPSNVIPDPKNSIINAPPLIK